MLKLTTVFFLITISSIALIHAIALQLFLYWRYIWLDMPMHALGGAAISLGIFTARDLRIPLLGQLHRFGWGVVAFVVLIMVLWEIFEIWAGIPILDSFYIDTAIDIVMGAIGATVGYVVARKIDTLEKNI